jgi:predicted glycoside hydrolase/deacetylase ChbG (UPF0249 family)
MATGLEPAYLIVNADDYGYFDCVSRGILRSASHGIVTATGVFATTARFVEHAAWLRDYDALDVGIHLNLTDRDPLTSDMRKRLYRTAGRFPRKLAAAMSVLAGSIRAEDVTAEWRAQIERCLASGLTVRFLNSHEHIHMLPPLFEVVRVLASEYGIPHVRFARAGLFPRLSAGPLFRSAVMKTLQTLNGRYADRPTAHFLGLEQSGKLDLRYLEQRLSRLRPGRVYELMCHPGHRDEQEVRDARLLEYHDWEGELNTLTSPAVKDLLHRYNVRIIGYRDLEMSSGRLALRQDARQHPHDWAY